MSKQAHARRRLRERLGYSPAAIAGISRALRGTHGYQTGPVMGVAVHFITYREKPLKVVFDWHRHRLVTVMPIERGGRR
jgi:hypothetical protein